jgi:hypothetical protein
MWQRVNETGDGYEESTTDGFADRASAQRGERR